LKGGIVGVMTVVVAFFLDDTEYRRVRYAKIFFAELDYTHAHGRRIILYYRRIILYYED
jgi:hypothetical protein